MNRYRDIDFGPEPKERGGRAEAAALKGNHMLNIETSEPNKKSSRINSSKPSLFSEDAYAREKARMNAWLVDKLDEVARKKGLFSDEITLTPAFAEVLLQRNPADENRRISPVNINRIVSDIKNGLWTLNGEPIIVSRCGLLNDGQNRCHAVILAGIPVRTMMVIGTPRVSRLTVDTGISKSAADFLSMSGVPDSYANASAGTLLWQFITLGRISNLGPDMPSKPQVQAIIADHPKLVDSVAFIPKRKSDVLGGRSTLGFCHYLFATSADRKAADTFIERLFSGANLNSNDPIHVARERLRGDRVERRRVLRAEKVELLIKAWNHHRRGRTTTHFKLNGNLPKVAV